MSKDPSHQLLKSTSYSRSTHLELCQSYTKLNVHRNYQALDQDYLSQMSSQPLSHKDYTIY